MGGRPACINVTAATSNQQSVDVRELVERFSDAVARGREKLEVFDGKRDATGCLLDYETMAADRKCMPATTVSKLRNFLTGIALI